jgi:hypothetical protein
VGSVFFVFADAKDQEVKAQVQEAVLKVLDKQNWSRTLIVPDISMLSLPFSERRQVSNEQRELVIQFIVRDYLAPLEKLVSLLCPQSDNFDLSS